MSPILTAQQIIQPGWYWMRIAAGEPWTMLRISRPEMLAYGGWPERWEFVPVPEPVIHAPSVYQLPTPSARRDLLASLISAIDNGEIVLDNATSLDGCALIDLAREELEGATA